MLIKLEKRLLKKWKNLYQYGMNLVNELTTIEEVERVLFT